MKKKIDTRKRIAFAIFVVLTVVWMAAIFGFSSNDAEESTVQSNAVTEIILRIFNRDFDEMMPEERQNLIDSCDRIVRKLAHFTAYAILGFLLYVTLNLAPCGYFGNKYKTFIFSFVPCVLFAATDEYHQTFVDGRAGRFSDILIDSSGVVCGVLFAVAVMIIFEKIEHRNSNKRGV